MPSLRKRVTSYFRQLSFHNEPREKRLNVNENAFVTKYLQGLIKLRDGPPVISGKTPTDLPNYDLGTYKTGSETIVGCYTGPNGGLTTVKRTEKHLSIPDDDIDFIDTQDDNVSTIPKNNKPRAEPGLPIDNTTMLIKVAGQEYFVTNCKKQTKSHSLGSLSDLNVDATRIDSERQNNNNSNVKSLNEIPGERKSSGRSADKKPGPVRNRSGSNKSNDSRKNPQNTQRRDSSEKKPFELSKSKSEGNPFNHKKRGKIIRVERRPTSTVSAQSATSNLEPNSNNDLLLPFEWCKHSEHVYGLSDSLYDKNLVTKQKNGDPIADCFGIIARKDSAILAVADGVNWGEKACVAAKSAVHGCLHYLNKTIFNDIKPFETLVKTDDSKEVKSDTPLHDNHMTNTQEVFVSLLRAFNCAHDLILENNGMLTTLTVAVILPLKEGGSRRSVDDQEGSPDENYVCCVCNVGDTLCYVYSHKYGVRELTKGSHDIQSNRDMRDALGALGPVDGTNPELSNLTLSVTKIQKGDIVLIASDGLTDNFDPNVCKFSVNKTQPHPPTTTHPVKPKRETKPATTQRKIHQIDEARKEKSKPPVKPPRRNYVKGKGDNISRSSTERSSRSQSVESSKDTVDFKLGSAGVTEAKNPLISSRGLRDCEVVNAKPRMIPLSRTLSMTENEGKAKDVPQKYNFLRSKTSLEIRPKPVVHRNIDGLPFVTPIQRYELTLLLMEDILRHGISGREDHCVTAKKLCENLMSFTLSITAAKRRTLEDNDMYFDNRNGLLVEASGLEKKVRRKRGLEKVQHLPGKLDHVTVVALNVGDFSVTQ